MSLKATPQPEELLKRSVVPYLPQVKAELTFEPIGFGMWADRPEMQDAAKWATRRWWRDGDAWHSASK